jgi:hypothetical protein
LRVRGAAQAQSQHDGKRQTRHRRRGAGAWLSTFAEP